MFEFLEKIWGVLGEIGSFFGSIFAAMKTAFLFIASVWGAVREQIASMPGWLQAVIVTTVIISIVLVVVLSR